MQTTSNVRLDLTSLMKMRIDQMYRWPRQSSPVTQIVCTCRLKLLPAPMWPSDRSIDHQKSREPLVDLRQLLGSAKDRFSFTPFERARQCQQESLCCPPQSDQRVNKAIIGTDAREWTREQFKLRIDRCISRKTEGRRRRRASDRLDFVSGKKERSRRTNRRADSTFVPEKRNRKKHQSHCSAISHGYSQAM